MTDSEDRISDVQAATIRAALTEPIRFGDWTMRYREFALVRVRSSRGFQGFSFALTRDGPVAAAIRLCIAQHYVGAAFADPQSLFERAQGANLPSLSNGIGLRSLSLVDLATWDLKARAANVSIPRLFGASPRRMPATAIIGYPPASMDPDRVRAQVSELLGKGWKRFKIPLTLPLEAGRDRILAAREAAGEDAWLGVDCAWLFRTLDTALSFAKSVRGAELGWIEDVFPPGTADLVAEFRSQAGIPVAMGDEQGGSYFPDALIDRKAVDVIRIDLTCMGGLSQAPALIDAGAKANLALSPHMYAHIHSSAFAALGLEVPIEWGARWTGVDPYADSLVQPTIVDGCMEPLSEEPGFGSLVNGEWLADQELDDPDGLVKSLMSNGESLA